MKHLLTAIALVSTLLSTAQNDDLRFGISVRPILPLGLLDTEGETLSNDGLTVTLDPMVGYNFGMFIQQRLTPLLAVETGIYTVRRNYRSSYVHAPTDTLQDATFALVGYEIPVQGLMYVQLGEQLFMNASGGFSIDMYPSDVFTNNSLGKDTLSIVYNVATQRRRWVQLGLVANYGFEWRTPKKGAWYMGASYHRPFDSIGETRSKLEVNGVGTTVSHQLNGSYLTVDVRYVFADNSRTRRP
ncbi:MAG: hypothetical protein ACON34_06680 [Flavobacteriales bacterium]